MTNVTQSRYSALSQIFLNTTLQSDDILQDLVMQQVFASQKLRQQAQIVPNSVYGDYLPKSFSSPTDISAKFDLHA